MQKWGLYIFKSQRLPSEERGQQPQPYCLARVKGAWRASCDGTWVHRGVRRQRRLCISFNDTQTEPRVWPPRRLMYRSVVTKLWGGGKFTKRQTRWQKSTNSPSKPASLSLSISLPLSLSHSHSLPLSLPTTPNRKARLLRRARYGTSPGDRYVTPPKTPWHNYTSVALKGDGRVERGGVGGRERVGGEEMVGTEREWVSERRSGGCAGLVVLVDALLLAYSKRQPKGCLSLF